MSDDTGTGTGTGPTVFVSYARADRAVITPLIDLLGRAGYRVWWDALIEGGTAFARSIEAALDAADVIVVAWSRNSIDSDWVRDEAAHGRDRRRFVPISIDGALPPIGFRQYHFIDFSDWRGAASAPQFAQLVAAIATVAGVGGDAARAAARPANPRRRVSRRAAIAGGVSGAAVIGVGLWGGRAAWQDFVGPSVSANSIAVLPFANLSNDPAQQYFSDGLSEEMRSRLGASGQFQVAAQTSSDLFRDRKLDAAAIATKLGVAYLLDGSVRRASNEVRIDAELIEASSGLAKWSQTFDRQLTDIFAVQREIADVVMQAIAGKVAPHRDSSGGTSNFAAYDEFLQGHALYQLDIDEASDRSALAHFDAAIAADPGYAKAYAARAGALIDIAAEYAAPGELRAMFAAAETAARQAIALAPDLPEAYIALGDALFTGRLDARAARPAYDRAYALGGGNADVLDVFAYFVSKTGRAGDALAANAKALTLDPLNPLIYRARGKFLVNARRYAEAIAPLTKAIAMNPRISRTWSTIGNAWLMQNRLDKAQAAFAAEPLAAFRLTGLAIVAHRRGDDVLAQHLFTQLVDAKGDGVLYQQAEMLAQFGKREAAFSALEKARSIGDSGVTLALTDPLLDPLRADPRFHRLLNAIGMV